MTLFDVPERAVPEGPLVRVRLTVAYDGTDFHGFAANPGVRTVAGTLAEAIERILRHQIQIVCAGRTDKGVHAQGQVISFDAAQSRLDPVALVRALNMLCGPTIAVRDPLIVSPEFDARHSARARRYRYTVLNRPEPDPFLARIAWQVKSPLELSAMRLACDPLYGEHDFASFCRRPKGGGDGPPPSLVRRVIDARWHDLGDGRLRFDIAASSFCQQMVRSIVGTMIDVGSGKRRAGEVAAMIAAGDRSAAGQIAPPHGLCLWEVDYG